MDGPVEPWRTMRWVVLLPGIILTPFILWAHGDIPEESHHLAVRFWLASILFAACLVILCRWRRSVPHILLSLVWMVACGAAAASSYSLRAFWEGGGGNRSMTTWLVVLSAAGFCVSWFSARRAEEETALSSEAAREWR